LPLHFWAAFVLEEAASAHLEGDDRRAPELIAATNRQEFRLFLDTLWGATSKYNSPIDGARLGHSIYALAQETSVERMPSAAAMREIVQRDGYRCRYCSIPVIPKEVRVILHKAYPDALPWGRKNAEQHSAFQALWMQFDHVVPHSMNGGNSLDNVVICCAGCNFGKSNYPLEKLGLANPFDSPPITSGWNGLTHLLPNRGLP